VAHTISCLIRHLVLSSHDEGNYILLEDQNLGARELVTRIQPSREDIVMKFENATGEMFFKFSELERHLDPFSNVRKVQIHKPLLSTQLDLQSPCFTTTNVLEALARPGYVFSKANSDLAPEDDFYSGYIQESQLQARLEELEVRVDEDNQELQDAAKAMLLKPCCS
jgi:hypothetical protein